MTWSAERRGSLGLLPGGLDEGDFFVPDFSDTGTDGSLRSALRRTVLYAHAQRAAVFYNAFLEGDAFGGRSDIEPKRGVSTTTLGFTVPIGRRGQHKIGLAFKRRSPEFTVRGEAGRDFYHRWGVLTYSYDYGTTDAPPQ